MFVPDNNHDVLSIKLDVITNTIINKIQREDFSTNDDDGGTNHHPTLFSSSVYMGGGWVGALPPFGTEI